MEKIGKYRHQLQLLLAGEGQLIRWQNRVLFFIDLLCGPVIYEAVGYLPVRISLHVYVRGRPLPAALLPWL